MDIDQRSSSGVSPSTGDSKLKRASKNVHLPRASWAAEEDDENFSKELETKESFVYESADITFQTSQFLWELMVHLCHPLFIWDAPVAHSFWPIKLWPLQFFYYTHGSPVVNFLLIIFASLTASSLGYLDCVMPILFWAMHRTMVSVKYACYSPSEYKKVRSNTIADIAVIYQAQSQLLTSWVQFDDFVTDLEFKNVSRITGADVERLHILLPREDRVETPETESSSFKSWQVFLTQNQVNLDSLERTSKGQVILPIKTLFLALIKFSFRVSKEGLFLTYIRALFPFILLAIRISIQIHQGCGPFCITFMILSCAQVYFFLNVNLLFLAAATNDAHRRLSIARVLSLFVRVDDRVDEFGFMTIPKMDLTSEPTTIYAWLYLRLMLKNYGMRMLFRLDLYVGAFLILDVALSLGFIYRLFTTSSLAEMFSDAIYAEILIVILATLLFLVIHIITAATVNSELELQQNDLIVNLTKIQSIWALDVESNESRSTKSQACATALAHILAAVKISDRTSKLKVLGMDANFGLVTTILTVVGTLVSSILTEISRKTSTAT